MDEDQWIIADSVYVLDELSCHVMLGLVALMKRD